MAVAEAVPLQVVVVVVLVLAQVVAAVVWRAAAAAVAPFGPKELSPGRVPQESRLRERPMRNSRC